MTVEERQKRFMELLQEAQRLTGIRLQPTLTSRTFGSTDVIQIEAVVNLVADPDWKPTVTETPESKYGDVSD